MQKLTVLDVKTVLADIKIEVASEIDSTSHRSKHLQFIPNINSFVLITVDSCHHYSIVIDDLDEAVDKFNQFIV